MIKQYPSPSMNYTATYNVCRTLPTLSCLSNKDLLELVRASCSAYRSEIERFDTGLPNHLRREVKATWLEFTCVTVHVCNVLNGFCLNPSQAASMMRHINLLYRVDDFMETLQETYGVHDISAARDLITYCFQPYLNTTIEKHAHHNATRIDSPLEEVPRIAKPVELEQDFKTILELMHTSPIPEASPQDQHWYTLELHDFFLAQLDQLSYRAPSPAEPTQLYKWVADIGARSVGTKYMFAGFSCMIAASRNQQICWPTALEMYLAQKFAQHVSVEFRLLNDVGGRVRDAREGTASCCSLVRVGEHAELGKIAAYEALCSERLILKLSEAPDAHGLSDEGSVTRRLLEFWRMTVRLSGELYMANDPTRPPMLSVSR